MEQHNETEQTVLEPDGFHFQEIPRQTLMNLAKEKPS